VYEAKYIVILFSYLMPACIAYVKHDIVRDIVRRDATQPLSYGNVAGSAGSLAGWLSVTAGIVSKRLNLS